MGVDHTECSATVPAAAGVDRRAADRPDGDAYVDGFVDGCLLVGPDGRLIDAGDTSRRALVGLMIWDVWPGAARATVAATLHRAAVERVAVHVEERIAGPGDGERWIELDAYPLGAAVAVVARDVTARRSADAALREAHRRLEFHSSNSPLAVVEWDAAGRITRWSDAAVRVFGWTAAEALGKTVEELHLVYEDDLPTMHRTTAAMHDGTAPRNVSSNRNWTKDGCVLHCEWYNSALRDADGRLLSVYSEVLDVTERVRAGRALVRTADRLVRLQSITAALAAAGDVTAVGEVVTVAVLDATGAAAGGLRVLTRGDDGRDALRVVPRSGYPARSPWLDTVPIDDATPGGDAVRSGHAVFLASHADWRARYPALGALHSATGFEAAAAIPCIDEGAAGVISLSFAGPHEFDENERALLQAIATQTAIALRRAQHAERADRAGSRSAFLADASRTLSTPLDVDELLALIARLPVPGLADYCMMYQLGRDGLVHRVSRTHGDPAHEALLDTLEREYPLAADSDLPAARVLRTQQAIFSPRLHVDELRAAAPDTRYLELLQALGLRSWITVPLVARGRSLGALIFATVTATGRTFDDDDFRAAQAFTERAALALDTTRLLAETESARAQAEAANQAKGQFLAVMSHELRTPLNAIAGYTELMELGVRGPVTDEQREDLGRIQRSQRHLTGLINQVLSYARVDRGGLSYDMCDVPLDETLRATEALVAPQLRARGLAYAYVPCDPSVTVRADAEKLRQVVLNLLSNAVKFTEPGGRVDVSCEIRPSSVGVRVRDTGRGIAPEKHAAIFDPFVQVDRTLASAQEGVGLGLAISRELARGMGGDLAVESAIGAGAVFTLTLPRV